MADIMQIVNTANMVPEVSNACFLAQSVCQARGQSPFEYCNFSGWSMQRWRAVVAESLMLETIRAEVLGNG